MIKDLLPYLIGLSGVILAIIAWVRFRKRDVASVNKINAEVGKTEAESHEIRARADVLITDGALRIVERLSKDLDVARDEIDRLEKINSAMKAAYDQTQIDFALKSKVLMDQIEESKKIIEVKKRHCVETKNRILQLRDLLLLKQQGLTGEQLKEFIAKLNELVEDHKEIK